MKRTLLGVATGFALVLVGCSPAAQSTSTTTVSPTATTAPAPTATTAPAATATTAAPTATTTAPTATTAQATPTTAATAFLKIGDHPVLGKILTDSAGRTLYYFDRDTPGVSNCTSAACLGAWPILAPPSGTITLQSGITAKTGTITRSDGPMQVTVNDLPVYYYTPDTNPGDAKGAGVGRVWWTIRPDGTKMNVSLVPTPTATTTGGAAPTATSGASAPTPTAASGGSMSATWASDIKGFKLETFTIPAGATVTWTNRDSAPHTATANNGAFDSMSLTTNATYSFTFSNPGTFDYHCGVHPSMTGTVTVTAASGAQAPAPTAAGYDYDY